MFSKDIVIEQIKTYLDTVNGNDVFAKTMFGMCNMLDNKEITKLSTDIQRRLLQIRKIIDKVLMF